MIKVDESDPVGEMEPSFPYRDVSIKRGTDVKEFYDLEGEIGRGKFGTVYKCREKGTNLTLAAKFVGIARRQDRRNVEREVEIMSTLQHPRLIQLYDAFETDNVMCVVLELIDGGELFERVIDDDFILTEKACTVFMRQICEGVAFIHSNNIIHLDLKPENILCLTKTGNRIKIIDFGLARKYEPDKKLQVLFGTPEFVAPEVVNFDQISCATDMWSVGVICYVLLSGLSPFMGETDVETMANVTIARYDFEDDSFEDISPEAKDFISKLLLKDKEARLTAAECLAHPWLRRKIPPPPPSLDSSKENLKLYVDKNVKNAILIENDLKEKPGVIEKMIEKEQKMAYPHLISKPNSEFSVLTNPKFQEFLDNSKDNSQFLKMGNQNFRSNENIINSKDNDSKIKTQNIPEISNNKINHINPLVNNTHKCNQTKNANIKKDPKGCFGDGKEISINSNIVTNQSSTLKGVSFDNDLVKKNALSSEILANTDSKNKTSNIDVRKSECIVFETKPQITEQMKNSIGPNKSGHITKIVGSTLIDPIQGSSCFNSNQQKKEKISRNEKRITEETLESHLPIKIPEDNAWFNKSVNLNTSSQATIPVHSSIRDKIQITLNDYKPEESARMFDLAKVSDFIRRSSIKVTDQDKTTTNICETLKDSMMMKEGETPSFKQHLRSTPPWFSELNNQHLKKPILDRFERRCSDFSCFLNSKEDSVSLNLADEIRKLSARLLQMSSTQNENVNEHYNLNPSFRSDPITCFLENHGISHPRPKYKFSNLNRDVPIGSPPPPSNIVYYLNMQSNLNRNDSHSAPGSPRTSPDRSRIDSNISLPTDTDTSNLDVNKEFNNHTTRHISEGNAIMTTVEPHKSEQTKNSKLNKTSPKTNFPS